MLDIAIFLSIIQTAWSGTFNQNTCINNVYKAVYKARDNGSEDKYNAACSAWTGNYVTRIKNGTRLLEKDVQEALNNQDVIESLPSYVKAVLLTKLKKENYSDIIDAFLEEIDQDENIGRTESDKLKKYADRDTIDKFLSEIIIYLFRYREKKSSVRRGRGYQKSANDENLPQHDASAKKYNLPSNLPDLLGTYIPRQNDMDRLTNLLEKGYKQIFVAGEGGLGKTEFVTSAAYALKKKYQFCFITYDKTLKQTIRNLQFKNWHPYVENNGQKIIKPEEVQYEEKLQLLMEFGSVILIIDNYDQPPEFMLEELGTLPNWDLRLLITTRTTILGKNEQTIEIKPFSPNELLGLMRKYVSTDYTDQDLLDLINKVHCHTLLVDLIARILTNDISCIHPHQLLSELDANNWSGETLGEKLPIEYNRNHEYRSVLEHLNVLFNVSNLSESAIYILCCSTLLPESGLNADIFSRVFKGIVNSRREISILRDTGWLKFDKHGRLYRVHPLIRTVCEQNGQTKPSWPKVKPFWDALDKEMDSYDVAVVDRLLQISNKLLDCFNSNLLAEVTNQTAYAQMNLRIGKLFESKGNYLAALQYKKDALNTLTQNACSDKREIAKCKMEISNTCNLLGDHIEAFKYLNEVAWIYYELQLPEDDLDRVNLYCNLACVLSEIEEPLASALSGTNIRGTAAALHWIEKAISIQETTPAVPPLDLANSYNIAGCIYDDLGEEETARTYYEKCLRIREENLSADDPSLAAIYNNIGCSYNNKPDLPKAIALLDKALKIRTKVLPENHLDLAASYFNIGCTYKEMGDAEKAIENMTTAYELRKKTLILQAPPHLDLICDQLCEAYLLMEDTEKALGFEKQAVWHMGERVNSSK